MKKRTIALMLSVLAVMMLVGVGFATWVISQSQELSSEGNIIVDTVTDERLFARVSVDETERQGVNDIIFGWKKPAEDFDNPWLTNEAADKEQNMKVVLKLEVFTDSAMQTPTDKFTINGKAPDQVAISDLLKIKAPKKVEDPDNAGEYLYAKEDPENAGQYIPAKAPADDVEDVVFENLVLPQWVVNASTFEKSSTGVYLITIEFTWADALSNLNPYLYFNASTSAATDKMAGLTPNETNMKNNGDAALKVLKDLEALKPAKLGGLTPELQYKVSLDIKYSE